jgi:tetratricopeptide (TPR) repeat protein
MRAVVIALQLLAPLALVFGIYALTMRDQVQISRRANRDDWRGVRDAAEAIIDRRRWTPSATRANAMHLVGLAHLVLGDLPAAQTAFERALATDLPTPVRAIIERHLAAVERVSGDLVGAGARLATSQSSTPDTDRWAIAAHRAEVLLAQGDPAGAEEAILDAIAAIEEQLGSTRLPAMRAALTADLTQAGCVLVRSRLDRHDVEGASLAWAEVVQLATDDRPMVQGQLAETRSRLAWAAGDADTATELVDTASARYGEVGARVEIARMNVLRARIDGVPSLLDSAEAELRSLGALGYLREVDEARREIG